MVKFLAHPACWAIYYARR